MRLLLICIYYPPYKTSAAVQMADLAKEIKSRNIKVDILTTDSYLKKNIEISNENGINVIRIKTGKFHNVSNIHRTINELFMPFIILINLIISKYEIENYDGIISWSPSIFFSPVIYFLKKINNIKSYLILRDIFPEWALDLGILKKGLIYKIFSYLSKLQYIISDVIGVQSENNISFVRSHNIPLTKIEVLNNWYSNDKNSVCKININKTILKNKKIVVYAGNIGAAQGIEKIVDLCEKVETNDNLGFLFIGRGSNFEKLKQKIETKKLKNSIVLPEIKAEQIPDLYKKCHIGLIILDERHKTHNIPGKFLSYLNAGLPVFALVNKNNDLIEMINNNKLGFATDNQDTDFLKKKLIHQINSIKSKKLQGQISKNYANKFFHPSKVVDILLSHFVSKT